MVLKLESYTIQEIEKLIKETPELINEPVKTKRNYTPLMTAVSNGDTKIVELLVNCENIDVNKKDESGESAISHCLFSVCNKVTDENRVKCLKTILDSGKCDIYDFHKEHNLTPLMIAAMLSDDVCLAEIIKAGYSSYHAEDYDVAKIIKNHFAAKKDEANNDDKDNDDEDASDVGSDSEDSSDDDVMFRKRRRHNEDSLFNDEFAPIKMYMNLANRSLDRTTYKTFYKKNFGKSIDLFDYKKGKTALMYCLSYYIDNTVEKQLACIKLLVEAGACVDVEDSRSNRPIDLAINDYYPADVSIIRYLISVGCKYNLEYDFLRAAKFMYVDIMRIFIEMGMDPKWTNGQGRNFLHCFFLNNANEHSFMEDELKEKRKKLLHYLIHDLKVNMNAQGSTPIFALAFISYMKGIDFPFLYLVSENIDYNILTSEIEVELYHYKFQDTVDMCLLDKVVDEYKLLYDIGVPYNISRKLHNCDNFEGENEPKDETKQWLKEIVDKPDTLVRICTFKLRKLLGDDIKTKVSKMNLPGPLKDKILLKDVLPADCFEDNWA
ncbi:hypothetical protein LOTGIDRAFT_170068 [Lottia gigantea]|uniref:Uncharacterized protein n=1 Tax=Lottia gigantea TaxID=225164 RepID=V3ZEE5_LOTGI|nr:hypothetical protein LOTGIDRAFT_170068 [Lottia gigantea]ESO82437.1 hypothetical protein LOTGIDRAFT_170068 [Lottia gigantea]